MKRNSMLIMYFLLLIFLILVAARFNLHGYKNISDFIMSSLTVLGTCGIVCLSIFPYKPRDKLTAILYYEPLENPEILKLKVTNETDHTITLGLRKNDASLPDNYLLWWPQGEEIIQERAISIWSDPGSILSIPPRSTAFHFLPLQLFGTEKLNKLRLKVQTNTGYKCDVINKV